MKTLIKEKLLVALKEAARAAVTALLTALGIGAIGSLEGCTVITPSDGASTVTVTGALPLGFQLNTNKVNN